MWYTRNRVVRGFSDRQARLFRWTTPNMISAFRILLALAIPPLACTARTGLAALVFAVAVYLDFVDGALARYQSEEGLASGERRGPPKRETAMPFLRRLRLKGATETGTWLDPLADKILVQTTLFALGWGVLPRALLFTGLAFAVLLTCLRPLKARMMSRGLCKTADGRSNAFGKIKMWVQTCVIATLFVRTATGIAQGPLMSLAAAMLALAIMLAALSFAFHLLPSRS